MAGNFLRVSIVLSFLHVTLSPACHYALPIQVDLKATTPGLAKATHDLIAKQPGRRERVLWGSFITRVRWEGHASIRPARYCSRRGVSLFIRAPQELSHSWVHHTCPTLAPASHLQVNAELYRTDPDIPLFMCAQRLLYLLAAYQVIIFTGGYFSPPGASSWVCLPQYKRMSYNLHRARCGHVGCCMVPV